MDKTSTTPVGTRFMSAGACCPAPFSWFGLVVQLPGLRVAAIRQYFMRYCTTWAVASTVQVIWRSEIGNATATFRVNVLHQFFSADNVGWRPRNCRFRFRMTLLWTLSPQLHKCSTFGGPDSFCRAPIRPSGLWFVTWFVLRGVWFVLRGSDSSIGALIRGLIRPAGSGSSCGTLIRPAGQRSALHCHDSSCGLWFVLRALVRLVGPWIVVQAQTRPAGSWLILRWPDPSRGTLIHPRGPDSFYGPWSCVKQGPSPSHRALIRLAGPCSVLQSPDPHCKTRIRLTKYDDCLSLNDRNERPSPTRPSRSSVPSFWTRITIDEMFSPSESHIQ